MMRPSPNHRTLRLTDDDDDGESWSQLFTKRTLNQSLKSQAFIQSVGTAKLIRLTKIRGNYALFHKLC